MDLQDEVSKEWKPGIYKNYSTIFKTVTDQNTYTQFIPYARHIIQTCLPENKNIRIIDLGCGIGGYTKAIAQAGYQNIQGIDISEESVAIAHKYGVPSVEQGDIFSFLEKTSDNSIDVVLCLDVLEHFIREEGVRLSVEVNRVLSPGGMMIIHVPNGEAIFGSKIRYADFTHEMAFTQKSIAQLLHYAGFGNVIVFEDKPLVHSLTSAVRRVLWSLLTFPFRILHVVETGSFHIKLSQNILVMAIKDEKGVS